jgi:hypothetical protein
MRKGEIRILPNGDLVMCIGHKDGFPEYIVVKASKIKGDKKC